MHISNKELAKRIAERTALPRRLVSKVLFNAAQEIQSAMMLGDTVTIHGLGRFRRSLFHSGNQVTPTGRPINRFVSRVYFRAGKALKKVISKSSEMFDAAER